MNALIMSDGDLVKARQILDVDVATYEYERTVWGKFIDEKNRAIKEQLKS